MLDWKEVIVIGIVGFVLCFAISAIAWYNYANDKLYIEKGYTRQTLPTTTMSPVWVLPEKENK